MSNADHHNDAKSCNDLSMGGGSNRSANSRVRAQEHCDNSDNCDNRDNLCLCDDGAAQNPNIAKARAIWDRSVPIQGTLAEVYLQGRGVAGSSLECLAFAMLHEDGQLRPTLIARIQDACGNTCGISRTFLASDGKTKAQIHVARKALGRVSGGAVRLGHPQSQLIVCEGLEDGLSLQSRLGQPVWVTLGATNLAKVGLPRSVQSVIIAQDNDAAGVEAAKKAAEIYTAQGIAVDIMRPPARFKDFNELPMQGLQCSRMPSSDGRRPVRQDPFAEAFDARESMEWPKPDPSYLDPDGATPLMPIGLFGPLYPYVEALAKDCSAPVDYVAHALLATAGSLLSGRIRVHPIATSSWNVTPVLWIGLVGNPSSRKTPAFESVLKPLRKLQEAIDRTSRSAHDTYKDALLYSAAAGKKYEDEVRAAARADERRPERPEGACEPERPPHRRLYVSDITIEAMCDILAENPEGLLCKRNELAGWYDTIDRYHAGSKPFWIEAYDGHQYVMDRRNREEPLILPSVCVSLLGTIQPDLVDKILLDPKDGGAARMVFVWPEPTCFRIPEAPVDHTRLFTIYERLNSLKFDEDDEGRHQPNQIGLTLDAADRFAKWVSHTEAQAEFEQGHYSAFLGKAGGTLLRVAGISEFLKAADSDRNFPEAISLDTIEAAIEWMDEYARPMALKVYGRHTLSTEERNARILLAYLRKHNIAFFNKRDIMRASGKHRLRGMRKADEFDGALNLLMEAGWVAHLKSGSIKPRGDYSVNPRLFKAPSEP